MLQQTRVETVVAYYHRFLKRFPTLADLARAREEEVLALWSGLGYYRRARSLLAGARQVVSQFGGEFPKTLEDALSLPGVGNYTAAAVLSIAYGLPHPVVDGNVERVITRYLRLPGNPKRTVVARKLREVACGWLPADASGDFNQALMELGATICTPGRPKCAECPLNSACKARQHGDADRFPRLPAPRPTEHLELEVGILESRGRYLMERPVDFGFLEGLWVFPLADTTKRTAPRGPGIAARLAERLGVDVQATAELVPLRHAITFRRIALRPIRLKTSKIDIRGRQEFRWARAGDFGRTVPVSSICLKIASRIDRDRSLCNEELGENGRFS